TAALLVGGGGLLARGVADELLLLSRGLLRRARERARGLRRGALVGEAEEVLELCRDALQRAGEGAELVDRLVELADDLVHVERLRRVLEVPEELRGVELPLQHRVLDD